MPPRFTFSPRVLHDNSHPTITIFVRRGTEIPNARVLHFHDRVNAFGRSELEDFDLIRTRHWITVQRDDVKFVTGQGQLNRLCSASVKNAKHDSLTFLNSDRFTVPQASAIDSKSPVADFPAVGLLGLIGIYFCFQSRVLRLTLLLFHLASAVERVKLVCSQKNFLIIASGIVIRLDVNDSELSGIQPAVEIASRHHMGMHPANPDRPRGELITDLPTRGDHNAFLFAGAIDLRRNELTMPMDKLRCVGVIKDLYRDWPALS